MLWRIFGPKRDEVTRELRQLHNEKFNYCTPRPISFGCSNREELNGLVMQHVWGDEKSRQVYAGET